MVKHVTSSDADPLERHLFGLSPASVRYRSQLVAYPFLLVSAILFLLQIEFGLVMAAQYVWPTFLMNSLPFNLARATHLNLLIFWLLLGLMGITYYLVPEETHTEIISIPLAYVQFGVMLLAGLGTLGSLWLLRQSRGKPFTESPMPWPWLIVLGVVLFLVNVGLTIFRSRRRNALSLILFVGMGGMVTLYLVNMIFFPNLTVDYYWWFWIIHLWVEGTWELIGAVIMAYLLIRLTGVERAEMYRWLYVEVALTLFTGIIGIGHHYYWIGTPAYWQIWGAIFGALEPIPIAMMAYDALMSMRRRRVEPTNRVAWYFLGGSAIVHFLGAGVWGFVINLPQINRWTHGTLVTASHGHFAFFGAFAMLVLAGVYTIVPQMKGLARIQEARGMWAFWLMTVGMTAMVLAFTIAGIVQMYFYRMWGMDFMTVRTQHVGFWMFWVWLFGLVLFLPGVLVYLVDFFALGSTTKSPAVLAAAGTALVPVIVVALLTARSGITSRQAAPPSVRPVGVMVPKHVEKDPLPSKYLCVKPLFMRRIAPTLPACAKHPVRIVF